MNILKSEIEQFENSQKFSKFLGTLYADLYCIKVLLVDKVNPQKIKKNMFLGDLDIDF
jgi:hypothetical protein